jgi:glycosyltransferase involved in cell wall biosynthesis
VAREPVVAVCTNRSPADVAEALAALSGQVPRERLALVASGLAAAEAAAHRAADLAGTVLEEPRAGLSLARNRALEWAAGIGAAAIAYVDDDAVVGDGWWDALAARWGAADESLAVVGGPIRPRWSVPPPEWVSDPLLPALTLLDLGPSERELDPEVTTVFGANISFAVDPLRGAGGFDPAYGHSGARVFFSEEDEAQRALARAGFRVLYAPELVVEHIIPVERLSRRSFVRRRFAYGRALGKRRGRSARAAVRQLATSGPGAIVALARRDGRLFMERAVRAAENAGVLAGTARRG